MRLGSGGDTTWDNLAVATEWRDLDFIGAEYFDYEDGSINGQSGGPGFDYDNDLLGNSFVGHTYIKSSWTGTTNVSGGHLSTLNSPVFRPLSGTLVSKGEISTVDGANITFGSVPGANYTIERSFNFSD